MVLPIRVVPINEEGFSKNFERIFPEIMPCWLWSSMCSLLEETKAISIPEKKAEKSKEMMM